MARCRLDVRAIKAPFERADAESVALQDAGTCAGEPLFPAVGIPLAGDAESAGVAGGHKLVEARPDADLHALARVRAEREGSALRRVQPDRGAILSLEVGQFTGRGRPERRAEHVLREVRPGGIGGGNSLLELGTCTQLYRLCFPVQLKLARAPFLVGAALLLDVLALDGLLGGAA
jgi:hypothetical protein